jgi:N-acetylneuraminic acid mutarotase
MRRSTVLAVVALLCVTACGGGGGSTANTWSSVASTLADRGYGPAATLLPNGRVLLTGGTDGTVLDFAPLASTEIYDPVADQWSSGASMANPRAYHTVTLLQNGKVLVAGGSVAGGIGNSVTANAELYDPSTNRWSQAGNMANARSNHTATLLRDGKVLVAGGFGAVVAGERGTASAELYDPSSNTWSSTTSMATARLYHTATLLPNGKVLVAGAYGCSTTCSADASAELYDPSSNTWSSTTSMTTARDRHTATLLPNGKVLVAGGDSCSTTCSADTRAELYDPSSNAWSSAGNMANARSAHTATLLQNGKVLVAGGDDITGAITASAELYDPSTNTWSSAGSMIHARIGNTATLLTNGTVLVTGGVYASRINGNGASCELYW